MKIKTLGDPHLGRRFKTGVPLHRLGEREELVWIQFERELMEANADIHVNMGDLFDKFSVPATVVLRAADIYLEAVEANPNTTFIVLRGNHDVSRDSEVRSSFDLFTRLVEPAGVKVVGDAPLTIGAYGFVGYQPHRPTSEVVAALPDDLRVVFGHWDITDFGGDNVIPTELLAQKGIRMAFSGHDHLARQLNRHGVSVTVTGSMQPYTHAEDPKGDLYRTVTLADLDGLDTKNLNLRVILGEGESLPTDLDCLSLTAMRAASEDITIDTSEFETFDIGSMLSKVLEGFSIKDELMGKFHDAQSA